MKTYRWKDKNPYCIECQQYHVPHLPFDYNFTHFKNERGNYTLYTTPQIAINKPIHKKRRFRKKYHQKEYQELGFYFEIKLREDCNYPDNWEKADIIFDKFFDYIHDYGLCLTGFPNGLITVCNPLSKKIKLHTGYIKLIDDYFKSVPEIITYRFDQLRDMWYLTDEEFDEIKKVEWVNK